MNWKRFAIPTYCLVSALAKERPRSWMTTSRPKLEGRPTGTAGRSTGSARSPSGRFCRKRSSTKPLWRKRKNDHRVNLQQVQEKEKKITIFVVTNPRKKNDHHFCRNKCKKKKDHHFWRNKSKKKKWSPKPTCWIIKAFTII